MINVRTVKTLMFNGVEDQGYQINAVKLDGKTINELPYVPYVDDLIFDCGTALDLLDQEA